jgi:hypothetical protein
VIPEKYLNQLHAMGLLTSPPVPILANGDYVLKPVTTAGNNIAGYTTGLAGLGDGGELGCVDRDAPGAQAYKQRWHLALLLIYSRKPSQKLRLKPLHLLPRKLRQSLVVVVFVHRSNRRAGRDASANAAASYGAGHLISS